MSTYPSISLRQAAILTGISSLIMFVAAMLAEMYMHQGLIVPDNATLTAKNILSQPIAFRIGIAAFLIVFVCDVLATWGLYIYLEPSNRALAMLMAWLRLIYTIIAAVALSNLLAGFHVLTTASYGTAFNTEQVYQQAHLFFKAFDNTWAIGFIFFGLHLGVLSYLVKHSGYMPKLLAYILFVAAIAYTIDNCTKLLVVDYSIYKAPLTVMVAIPSILGELGLALWLLIKGTKISV
jgi:hypothetical protein